MRKLKVTQKDINNLRWALNVFSSTRLDGDEKEEKSMTKTFDKVFDVLLEKLKEQDK